MKPTILVPFDFSSAAESALAIARLEKQMVDTASMPRKAAKPAVEK